MFSLNINSIALLTVHSVHYSISFSRLWIFVCLFVAFEIWFVCLLCLGLCVKTFKFSAPAWLPGNIIYFLHLSHSIRGAFHPEFNLSTFQWMLNATNASFQSSFLVFFSGSHIANCLLHVFCIPCVWSRLSDKLIWFSFLETGLNFVLASFQTIFSDSQICSLLSPSSAGYLVWKAIIRLNPFGILSKTKFG